MPADPFYLARFVEAQDGAIERVRSELRGGRKTTHWIWYIFPQLKCLGQSAMSEHFGLSGLDEARAFLAHPVLGPRLLDCIELVLAARPSSIEAMFGTPDHMKFHSCLTLFAEASASVPLFGEALATFFDGQRDGATLRLLAHSP